MPSSTFCMVKSTVTHATGETGTGSPPPRFPAPKEAPELSTAAKFPGVTQAGPSSSSPAFTCRTVEPWATPWLRMWLREAAAPPPDAAPPAWGALSPPTGSGSGSGSGYWARMVDSAADTALRAVSWATRARMEVPTGRRCPSLPGGGHEGGAMRCGKAAASAVPAAGRSVGKASCPKSGTSGVGSAKRTRPALGGSAAAGAGASPPSPSSAVAEARSCAKVGFLPLALAGLPHALGAERAPTAGGWAPEAPGAAAVDADGAGWGAGAPGMAILAALSVMRRSRVVMSSARSAQPRASAATMYVRARTCTSTLDRNFKSPVVRAKVDTVAGGGGGCAAQGRGGGVELPGTRAQNTPQSTHLLREQHRSAAERPSRRAAGPCACVIVHP